MKRRILSLVKELTALVKDEAKKEKNYTHGEAMIFTEFLKELEFYKSEIEDLAKEDQ
jgi:hypothetical protein